MCLLLLIHYHTEAKAAIHSVFFSFNYKSLISGLEKGRLLTFIITNYINSLWSWFVIFMIENDWYTFYAWEWGKTMPSVI